MSNRIAFSAIQSSTADGEALDVELVRRFRTADTAVPLPSGGVTLVHPANADDLITEEDFVRDERLPYWADLWPSALVLASRVAAGPLPGLPPRDPGTRLLELGCGMGLVSVAAARAGYDVLATDYYTDALDFTRLNAWRNGVVLRTRHVDWRAVPPDLGRFDVILASDVLYERAYAGHVADILLHALTVGGVAIIADPGRIALPDFLDECRERELELGDAVVEPFEAGKIRQTITLHVIRRVQPSEGR